MCGAGATNPVYVFGTPFQLLAQTSNNLRLQIDVTCVSVIALTVGWTWINGDPGFTEGGGQPNSTCANGSGLVGGFDSTINNDWQIVFAASDDGTQQWLTNCGRIERL